MGCFGIEAEELVVAEIDDPDDEGLWGREGVTSTVDSR